MPATLKPERAQQYSLEIGNMIADAFSRPETSRFGGVTQYEQVFIEPDFSAISGSAHLPRRRAGDSSIFGSHVGPIYGPINPNLLPFSMQFIGYPALTLLRQNILIQNIITTYAEEMTKKWVIPSPGNSDSVDEEQIKQLIRLDKKWKGETLFRKALTEQGFSGGCLVFIDVDQGDENLEAPLSFDAIGIPKGSLKGFRIIEPMNCYAMGYNAYNPLAENYFIPQYWNIQGRDVHASRFLYFAETDLPILLRPAYMFFGIPMPQMLLDYVYNFERSRDAAARALRNHSLLGLMTDLSSILQTGTCANNPQSIINRLKIMQATRDQDGIALLNKETEEFFQITTPLTGVQDLVTQQLELLSLVTRIPVTKLFLSPPKGFSTTDEMSEQNWAQVINGRQKRLLQDNVVKFHKIIMLNEWGDYLRGLEYEWPDVRDMNAKEKAELQNQLASRDATLVGAQILDPLEVRERMAADEESGYAGIYIGDDWEPEAAIEEAEEIEEGGETHAEQEKATQPEYPKAKSAGLRSGDATFKEEDHPRKENGQFGKGGGASGDPQTSSRKSYHSEENSVFQHTEEETQRLHELSGILGETNPSFSKNSKEASSIERYMMVDTYGAINNGLREGKLGKKEKEIVEGIDAAFKDVSPLSENIESFRGIDSIDFIPEKVGEKFSDNAFTSTSIDPYVAVSPMIDESELGEESVKQFVIKVEIPKGSKVLYTNKALEEHSDISTIGAYHEGILPRGSEFEVVERSADGATIRYIPGTGVNAGNNNSTSVTQNNKSNTQKSFNSKEEVDSELRRIALESKGKDPFAIGEEIFKNNKELSNKINEFFPTNNIFGAKTIGRMIKRRQGGGDSTILSIEDAINGNENEEMGLETEYKIPTEDSGRGSNPTERPNPNSLREAPPRLVRPNALRSPGTHRKSSEPFGTDPARIRTAPDGRCREA